MRVPAAVGNLTSQRVGGDVYISFPVPSTNVDGKEPADIAALEIYAITAKRAPATEEERELATLVATVPVRPLLPELPVPANGSAPPPIPLPPGVDRGATVVVREPITPDLLTPVEFPNDQLRAELQREEDVPESEGPRFSGPLVAPAPTQLPGKAASGRSV